MTSSSPGQALRGIRVLDLTQFEAGTSTTQALAWLGAEVIKIEEPTQGDQGRRASTNRPDADSHYFIVLNCNKKSATLNLRDERGKEMLRRMIPSADVFIENFAPGAIERLGFAYEEVSALNPRIIYAQIKGFGSDSPYARYLAFDMVAQAMGGAMSITGTEETGPLKAGLTLGDTGTGMHCVTGILAALYQRFRTGRGQRVEVAMQEAVINFCRICYAAQHMSGRPAPRTGNRNPLGTSAPANLYPCRPFGPNDYCYIYTSRAGNNHWDRLLTAIGRSDLVGDPTFSSPELRLERVALVDGLIAEWTGSHTKQEVLRILGEAGVPVGAVLDTGDLASDPYLRQRGTFVAIQHPVRGEVVVPGWPVKLSDSPTEVLSPPLLGQHNAEVYGEWLGLAPGDLEQLRAEKVI